VERIRAGRDKPGLRPQHLAGLEVVASLSAGTLVGAHVGSTDVTLHPGSIRCGGYEADTKTAGSCTLLAQVALPVALFATPRPPGDGAAAAAAAGPGPSFSSAGGLPLDRVRLVLKGGTDADLAPPIGYLQHVLLPTLARHLGVEAEAACVRRGFFPRGGGEVHVTVRPLQPGKSLESFDIMDPRRVVRVRISAFVAGNLRVGIAKRLVAAARAELQAAGLIPGASGEGGGGAAASASSDPKTHMVAVEEEVRELGREEATGDGCGLLLVAESDTGCLWGAAAPGKKGVTAEDIGRTCARELAEDVLSGGCVDRYMQD
jgi:RNA 3'-terminal phosphate cyclase (ATP)